MSSNYQKLQALHRARKEKLDSTAVVVDAAKANFQKRVEQMQVWFSEARQELKTSQDQLSDRRNELLLKQSNVEKAQEDAAAQAAKDDAQLREHRVLLDAQEEDLAAHEEALDTKLCGKDEEIEKLVMQRTQELEQKHKDTFDALAAKNELVGKVEKLEVELEKHSNKVSRLKSDREKTAYTLAELRVAISKKTKQISAANDSMADLKLKLTTLEETLEGSRAHEKTLAKDLQDEKQLLGSAAANYNDSVKGIAIWTECLIDVVERLTTKLSIMGMSSFKLSHDERVTHSSRVIMFFEAVVDALKLLHSSRATQLAKESRKLCRGVLLKVLTKVAYKNPGLNLTNVLDSLPEDANCSALEDLVGPIVNLVDQVKRVEGQRRD
nr:uncharacterized protein LOC109783531 [Aegilops tauschii subsp. strangulata]